MHFELMNVHKEKKTVPELIIQICYAHFSFFLHIHHYMHECIYVHFGIQPDDLVLRNLYFYSHLWILNNIGLASHLYLTALFLKI